MNIKKSILTICLLGVTTTAYQPNAHADLLNSRNIAIGTTLLCGTSLLALYPVYKKLTLWEKELSVIQEGSGLASAEEAKRIISLENKINKYTKIKQGLMILAGGSGACAVSSALWYFGRQDSDSDSDPEQKQKPEPEPEQKPEPEPEQKPEQQQPEKEIVRKVIERELNKLSPEKRKRVQNQLGRNRAEQERQEARDRLERERDQLAPMRERLRQTQEEKREQERLEQKRQQQKLMDAFEQNRQELL